MRGIRPGNPSPVPFSVASSPPLPTAVLPGQNDGGNTRLIYLGAGHCNDKVFLKAF